MIVKYVKMNSLVDGKERIPSMHSFFPDFVVALQLSIYFLVPATHGLGTICSAYPWFSTHAALVSQNKTAHELHELPRRQNLGAPSLGVLVSWWQHFIIKKRRRPNNEYKKI